MDTLPTPAHPHYRNITDPLEFMYAGFTDVRQLMPIRVKLAKKLLPHLQAKLAEKSYLMNERDRHICDMTERRIAEIRGFLKQHE